MTHASWTLTRRWLWPLAAAAAMTGCSTDPTNTAGFETGPCIGGECFDGLMCLSQLCVGGDDPSSSASASGGPETTSAGASSPADDSNGAGSNATGADTTGPAPTQTGDDETSAGGTPADCDDDPGLPLGSACDPIAQDCAGCDKCTALATSGGSWDANRCVGTNQDAVGPGQPCVVIGSSVSGIDNCERGAMCWGVDSTTLTGTCVELCSGSAMAPVCTTPGSICSIFLDGVLPVCLVECDPLAQDCDGGEGCYVFEDDAVCLPSADDLPSGSQCNSLNTCAPGLLCQLGGGGCDPALFCCGAACDPGANDCAAGLECEPLIPGVGVCSGPS